MYLFCRGTMGNTEARTGTFVELCRRRVGMLRLRLEDRAALLKASLSMTSSG